MNVGNKSELGIWKYDYFQIPFSNVTGKSSAQPDAQNALSGTCSSTAYSESQANGA